MTFTFGNLFFVEAYGSSDHLIDLYGSEDMDLNSVLKIGLLRESFE